MWLIILASISSYVIYNYIISLNYWKKQGVAYLTPVPILGNLYQYLLGKRSFADITKDVYDAFPGKRYVGFYSCTVPTLLIKDPNLIKKLTVNDFDYFPDHRTLIPDDIDPMWSNNLLAMKGDEKWHNMRAILSPSFTSSKMRTMFELIQECSSKFVSHFSNKSETVEVEMKDAFSRFTNDVIATTAFGISVDSLQNVDNEVYTRGKSITDFSGLKGLKLLLFIVLPSVARLFGLKIITTSYGNFFKSIICDAMKLREEKSIYRPDMINLLMEARKGVRTKEEENTVDSGFAVVQESHLIKSHKSKIDLSDDDITAQAIIFYFAGFDTSSTMMSHAAHELAVNPDIQERLRKEVDETWSNCDGNLTYEAVLGMKYLDMVISETLRKWPLYVILDRKAVKPYTITPERPDEKPLQINAGDVITVPVHAIHRDPQFYPNSEKFDPERFSDENKHNIVPFTFLAFGAGLRSCIGSRLVLLEGKLIIAEILRKFEIVPVGRTKIPLEISKRNVTPIPDEGFWLGLKPRQC